MWEEEQRKLYFGHLLEGDVRELAGNYSVTMKFFKTVIKSHGFWNQVLHGFELTTIESYWLNPSEQWMKSIHYTSLIKMHYFLCLHDILYFFFSPRVCRMYLKPFSVFFFNFLFPQFTIDPDCSSKSNWDCFMKSIGTFYCLLPFAKAAF